MSDHIEKIYIKILIAIVASATVSGMLSKESTPQKIKNFVAGICGGGLVAIVGSEYEVSHGFTLIASIVMTGFVTVLWPLVGDMAKKYLESKNIKL